ncbi:MAG: hypothetical protein H6682_04600 [Candidatus Eisenbacteria bacterium]|nr:hypothetical protein [Candidatus Eisenbacteria bacterium]
MSAPARFFRFIRHAREHGIDLAAARECRLLLVGPESATKADRDNRLRRKIERTGIDGEAGRPVVGTSAPDNEK